MAAPDLDEPSPRSSASSKEDALQLSPHAPEAILSSTRQQPPRKRRRIIISCTECHRRKQKCDRSLPCTNCVSRNKQDACRYETGAPTAKAAQEPGVEQQVAPAAAEARRHARSSKYDIDPRLVAAAATAATVGTGIGADSAGEGVEGTSTNFGYSGTGASTLGFLKRIDDGGESLASLAMGARDNNTAYFGTRERYKSLVRQLPARPYIEKLVDIYFKDFNWQYNVSLRARGCGNAGRRGREADLFWGWLHF